uniref:ribosomal protein S7 n=1 Tax=Euplotes cristatus TaxID=756077 RepID=UPI002E769ED1|nr:ribosomal protein S7 [Euplotes cristatus]UPM52082.1 ribosomal protein S7 [Euplotes cristatus]
MHFTFVPTFLFFFKRFNYLPSRIKYKYLTFSNSTVFRSLFSLFIRHGSPLSPFRRFFLLLFFTLRGFGFLGTNCGVLPSALSVVDSFFFKKITNVFLRLRFVFFFFFYKLNKLIYKYSNYRRPRYSLEFRYVPPYRRFKELLKYMRKSLVYYKGRTFRVRFGKLFWDLLWAPEHLQFVRFSTSLQTYLFKTRKYLLFYR